MKKNVLVFPCGSEIGLEIYRSACYSTHFHLIGGSSVDDHGQFVYRDYIGNMPMVSDPDFITALNKIIVDRDIDLVIPAHDDVVVALAKASDAGALQCGFVGSSAKTSELTRSKSETYQKLRDVVPTPKQYAIDDVQSTDLPLFIKPDKGQGSKGAQRIDTPAMLEACMNQGGDLIISEYLPGKEYTVDCLSDHQGTLLYAAGRTRSRIANGISVRSTRHNDTRFQELAEQINNALDFKGAWFFQLKERQDGELVLLEIAPRIAGTMGLSRAHGINLPLLSMFIALDMPVTIEENDYDITVDRALSSRFNTTLKYEHVYIDFDDVVLHDDVINVEVVAFLMQCRNNNKQLHLITRHATDIFQTLEERKLSALFDEVIHITDGAPKSQFITERPAIFIDDSFAERKEVREATGIAVFDLHMIETLMEA